MMNKGFVFNMVHGFLKGGVRNMISFIHSKIPSDLMVSKKEDVKNMPELYNVLEAYELTLKDFEKYNSPGMLSGKRTCGDSLDMLEKGKDILATCVANDTAWYLMMEYFFKRYCEIKFKDSPVYDEIMKAFDAQWQKRMEELMLKETEKANGASVADKE